MHGFSAIPVLMRQNSQVTLNIWFKQQDIVQNFPTSIEVVAGALIGSDGRILMQKRRLGGTHGGLWEFPGGKIESAESPECALVRELHEELGITIGIHGLEYAGSSKSLAGSESIDSGLVIHLYICRSWRGEPHCLEAQAIAWFETSDIPALAMPPLDYPLAEALLRII